MAAMEGPTENASSVTPYQRMQKETSSNACKILEPTRKTIEMLEAQRVMAVLEDTIHRLELVMALQQVLQHLDRFKVMLGADLVDLLESHQARQKQYQITVARLQKENLKMVFAISPPLIDTGSHDDNEPEVGHGAGVQLADVENSEHWKMLKKDTVIAQQGLKYSLLDILRYFKKNPKAVQGILELKLPCAPAYRNFLDYMDLLQTVVKEKLLTQPSEEIKRKKSIIDILKRERRTNAMKQRLEAKYQEALKDKNDERTFKIGTEVFNWVQKYDADMGARQDEIDRIQKIYEGEKEDLFGLEEEFKIIEAKYETILKEKRQAIEAARRREEEIEKRNSAATAIQTAWKSYIYKKNQKKKAQKKQGKKGRDKKQAKK